MNQQTFAVKVDGVGLQAVWAGPRRTDDRKPVLVFLHDDLGSISLWRDFPSLLADRTGLPAFVYERAGHGESDEQNEPRTARYLHHEALEVLPKVLAANGIDRIIPIGHGEGGAMALLFAGAHPSRTRCMATLAARVFVEDRTVAGVNAAMASYGKDLRDRLERFHGDKTDALFSAWADLWSARSFKPWNLAKELADVSAPLVALLGERDDYASEIQLKRIAETVTGPVETLLLPECGHAPHIQATDKTLAAIAAFIRRYG